MKKKWLFIPIFILILILTLLPASLISANPGEIVVNGDFQTGIADPWDGIAASIDNDGFGNYFLNAYGAADAWSGMRQCINTSDPNFFVSYSVWPQGAEDGNENPYVYFRIYLYPLLDCLPGSSDSVAEVWDPTLTFTDWQITKNRSFTEWWDDQHPGVPIPDFQSISINCYSRNSSAWYDDVSIVYKDTVSSSEPEPEPVPMWERGDQQMVCYQVWVNDDGCFEFVFWWEYKDNNHVMIYDMEGTEVFSIDMPYGKASFEACLGDGTYTVKTFHDDMSEPLQEFTISKP
jgi:hypothetical protein